MLEAQTQKEEENRREGKEREGCFELACLA